MAYWTSALRKPRRFAALPPHDRRTLLAAALLLPLVTVARRVLRFKRLYTGMARIIPLGRQDAGARALSDAQHTARLVQIAAAHGLPGTTCLDRSLVLWGLLRRRGIPAELCLGARKLSQEFEAHAWVEYRDVVVNDTDDVRDRYAVFEWLEERITP